jgi:hypothetical protein
MGALENGELCRERKFQDINDRCALCRPLLDDVYGALR